MKIAKRAAADQANAIQADAAEKLKQAQADAFQIARAAADYKRAQAYAGVFEIVSKFDDEWKDRGSGALLSATFYKPLVSDGYLTLGHFAWPSYGAVRGNMLALKADGPVPWKYPVDYKKVWDDSGSGANWDGSFWAAIAPPGYAAVGMLAQRGYKKPKRTEIVCLREDFVERYDPDVMIWNDRGSGADDDVSVWLIGRLGTFYAHRKYKDPGESAATLADHALFPVQGKEPGEALRNTITWAKDFKTLGDLSEHQSVVTPVTEKNYVPLCDAIVNFKDSTRPALPLLWLDGILPWQYPTDYQAHKLADGWIAWEPRPPKGYASPGVLLRRGTARPGLKEVACVPEEFLQPKVPTPVAGMIDAFQLRQDPDFGAFAVLNKKKTVLEAARFNSEALRLSKKPRATKLPPR